jgi:DNA invertase Pin-like site-specific DNA recombinase
MAAKTKPTSKTKPTADPKPIAAYLRVSAADQKTDSQRAEVTAWLERNGHDLDQVGWYQDVESGRKMSRPMFDRLQADIHAGHVKTVVVWKVDRLARRLREGLDVLCAWCDKGVRFVSTTQPIDVSGTFGKTVAALMLGLAEIEWEYRLERQKVGIKQAKTRGVYKGRKPGTTIAKPQRARELRGLGNSPVEIAKSLGVSLRTVFRYLGAADKP